MARVVLAMSGGVDSSVAAHLLVAAGHDVTGVFMRHGEKAVTACSIDGIRENSPLLPVLNPRADHKQGCCSALDAEDGRRVAQQLGIPWYALNLEEEFGEIIDYFVDEYTAGRTPNPCVMCNNWIKFGKLFDYADSIGADFVATGHYARLAAVGDGSPAIFRGVDSAKDQSYVLFGIQREYLSRMMLPVGEYRKPEIRRIAEELGFDVATKKDSQEICFVTSGHHGEFVRARQKQSSTAGEFVTTDGRIVGQHSGIENYTIGQRKGLGIALGEPWFVVRIDEKTHAVVLGRKEELASPGLLAKDINWLTSMPPKTGVEFSCAAQIRYNSRAHAARGMLLDDGRLRIEFEDPVDAIAPGQAVVCYEGDRVLGGGWIESPSPVDP